MVRVSLTPFERALAAAEGARRHRWSFDRGVPPWAGVPVEAARVELSHIDGAVGEMAAAVHLGCVPVLRALWAAQQSPVRGQDDLPGIDVKTTRYLYGSLLVPTWEYEEARKKYILCVLRRGIPHLAGWADVDLLHARAERVSSMPGRVAWRLWQKDLHTMDSFPRDLDGPAGTV